MDDYLDAIRQHIADIERRLDERIDSETEVRRARREDDNRASDKFEVSVGRRFDQVNEFRGALEDLGKTMATRAEVQSLEDRVGRSEAFQARLAGVFAVAVLLLPILTAILYKRVA